MFIRDFNELCHHFLVSAFIVLCLHPWNPITKLLFPLLSRLRKGALLCQNKGQIWNPKSHANLHSKPSCNLAMFQKNWMKILGAVTLTRFCCEWWNDTTRTHANRYSPTNFWSRHNSLTKIHLRPSPEEVIDTIFSSTQRLYNECIESPEKLHQKNNLLTTIEATQYVLLQRIIFIS